MAYFGGRPVCGCWYWYKPSYQPPQQIYLAQVELSSSTKILASTSHTTLTQTFCSLTSDAITEAQYVFPLYDGVSVVSFKCTISKRTIYGVVKEKQEAKTDYQNAVDRGETAGLFEQSSDAADVFTTKIGNIPRGEKVIIEIVYLGELKHDAESDGARFTIPSHIAPRYGDVSHATSQQMTASNAVQPKGINIVVEIAVENASGIRSIESPSHPISVCIGRMSSQHEDIFQQNLGSATLAIANSSSLDRDFIIIVNAQGQDTPRALLETYPDGSRALMTTLVPKFNLQNMAPEIVFVCDRSGSMDSEIPMVKRALGVFLKSLPLNAKFNICSFGSSFSLLFNKSKPYDAETVAQALHHVDTFAANFGGTELLQPIKAVVQRRLSGVPLEIMVLTDGQLWNQQQLFDFINEESKNEMRVFSLGIGAAGSSTLVEGMARAGRGFSQSVSEGEVIDKRVVRMLKAALTPHIKDYSLKVQYATDEHHGEEDFEIIETETISNVSTHVEKSEDVSKPILLFQKDFQESPPNLVGGKYDHLPSIRAPEIIQTPSEIPSLFAFSRTTIYILLGPSSPKQQIKSILLSGTCAQGPVQLEIPVEDVGQGKTLHQLAAKKIVQEFEEGRGWLAHAKTADGTPLKQKHEGYWERIVEREAVRIGVKYQVGGRYCSFVAVERGGEGQIDKQIDTAAVPVRERRQESMMFGKLHQKPMHSQTAFSSQMSSGALYGMPAPRAMMASAPAPSGTFGAPAGGYGGARSRSSRGSGWLASTKAAFGMPAAAPSAALPPPPPATPGGANLFFSGPSLDGSAGLFSASTSLMPRKSKKKSVLPGSFQSYAVESERSMAELQVEEADMSNASPEVHMHEVIKLQEFDGSWKRIEQLLKTININREQYDRELTNINDDAVKATAIALAWLQNNVPNSKDVWDMLADKAQNWLASQPGIDDVEILVERATNAFFYVS